MLEVTQNSTFTSTEQQQHQKILKMRVYQEDDRIAGSIPVWSSVSTAKDKIAASLTEAQSGKTENGTFKRNLSYVEYTAPDSAQSEEFGFGDLVDMVNPLQHLPLVNSLYREMTGDEIKPISKIIGGAVYGGGIGAGSAVIDTVVEAETGKDITQNLLAFGSGETPSFSTKRTQISEIDQPEERLNTAVQTLAEYGETPFGDSNAAIAFSDLGAGKHLVYERKAVADGRTAGTYITKRVEIASFVPARDPITEVSLSDMPPREFNNY